MKAQHCLNLLVLVCLVFSSLMPLVLAQARNASEITTSDVSPEPDLVPLRRGPNSSDLQPNQITLTHDGFTPEVLTTTVGSQVTWLNSTGQTHILASGQPLRIYLPIIFKQAGQTSSLAQESGGLTPQISLTASKSFSGTLLPGGTFTHTFTEVGSYAYYLTTAPQFSGQVVVQAATGPLTVTLSANPSAGSVPLEVDFTATAGNAAGTVLTYTWEFGDGITDTVPFTTSFEVTAGHYYPVVGSYPVTVTVSDGQASASAQQTITVNPHTVALPPDPANVAPELDRTVATTLFAATEFLYAGDPPIQTGVAPGTIDPQRASVLRGRVLDRQDNPLPGVAITIFNHPEFGQTLSRADGMFDLAVNGGGVLTIKYDKAGYLPAQRQVDAPWQDYVRLPDVVLIPLDSQVTKVDLTQTTEDFTVARGSVVSDVDGTRQATLLVPQGTEAELVMSDGTTQPIDTLTIRATEFTVSDNGPETMPAELPPQTGYTYAIEFSTDEALAAGASSVQFDRPLYFYVEDFIGFPVGSAVPTGYYDKAAGQWVASENGYIIGILSISGGLAELDTDGDGVADDEATLAALSITNAERAKLATLYPQPPQTMWRVPVTHFTMPYDCNNPYAPPEGAGPPPPPSDPPPSPPDPCGRNGSIIKCQTQILGERLPLVGTPFSLNYHSDRGPGQTADYTLEIPLSGSTLPPNLAEIILEIEVAGQQFEQIFVPQPNLSHTFTWDGRDGYGRSVQGKQPVTVRLGYAYPAIYYPVQSDWERAFSSVWGGSAGEGMAVTYRPGLQFIFWQRWEGSLGPWDARAQAGLGGWSLDVHHGYDFYGHTLYRGDGSRRSTDSIKPVIRTVAGGGVAPPPDWGDGGPATEAMLYRPRKVAVAPDGSLYIADTDHSRIRRVGPDGIITTVAGTTPGFSGDGGPATSAQLDRPWAVTLAPDGSLYIADTFNLRVRRVGPDGIITTVAGGGTQSGDGGPATEAFINGLRDVAVAPDGSLYLVDDNRIRRVGPDGLIWTVTGTGTTACTGDGGLATQAGNHTPFGLAIGPDGSLYIADHGCNRVRRISTDGIITTTVGTGTAGFGGDGGPATAAQLYHPSDVAVAADGSLYIADKDNHRVRRVGPDGIITTVAGTGVYALSGDGGPATQAELGYVQGVALAPDDTLFMTDSSYFLVRQVYSPLASFDGTDLAIPSEDGDKLYQFNASGRHLRTLHALTGATLYEFGYDSNNLLVTVTDGDGNVTTIERDGAGNPTAIVGPYGQHTTLTLDGNGYLASIANPAGETHVFTYTGDGLLTDRLDPRGHAYQYTYDDLGRLVRADDPAGGFKTLTRTETDDSYEIALTTAEGRTTTYAVERLPTGETRLVNTFPGGQSNEVLIGTDGSQVVTYTNGTVVTEVEGPDPRWGMLAPIQQSLVISTPAGLQFVMEMTRTVTLADSSDPLSLQTQADQITLDDRTYSLVYDVASHQLTTTSPEGRQVFATIDAQGRPISEQVAGLLYPDQYSYDGQGRLERISAGPGDDPAVDRLYQLAYNPQGYLATLTDPLGRNVHFAYDQAGRPTLQTLADGRQIGFSYDLNGNLNSLTPPGRPTHAFSYTSVNLTGSYTPPTLPDVPDPATNYSYNLDRDLEGITRPDGLTLDPVYDSTTGRLRQINLPGGRSLEFDYYDGNPPGEPDTGQVRQIASLPDKDTVTYSYDGTLLTGESWAGTVQGRVGWAYDDDFRVRAQTINSATFFTATFSYDNDGLLNLVSSSLPTVPLTADLSISRNPDHGLVTGVTLDNVTTSRSYNDFGELAASSAAFNSTPLFEAAYDTSTNPRDKLGRITDLTETVLGVTTSFQYAYDQTGRLIDVWRNGDHLSHYGYDPNGNRITHTHPISGTGLTPAEIVYDDQDRLRQYGTKSYTYTANGELLRMTDNGQTISYDYDVLGNLRGVTLPDGTQIEYVIDGRNRHTGKKVNGVLVQGFLYQDQLNPVAELDGANNVVSVFVYASRPHSPDYMLSKKYDGSTWVAYRIVADHLGSPRLVVNATTGQVVQQLAYDEFGQVLIDTNPGFQPFGFAGGIYDQHTGLTRFGARDYDAEVGRWTAKDPIGFGGGDVNLYRYALNDPVNKTDASGMQNGEACDPPQRKPEDGFKWLKWLVSLFGKHPLGKGPLKKGIEMGEEAAKTIRKGNERIRNQINRQTSGKGRWP